MERHLDLEDQRPRGHEEAEPGVKIEYSGIAEMPFYLQDRDGYDFRILSREIVGTHMEDREVTLPDLPCAVLTYDTSPLFAEVLPGALVGDHEPSGRLPVTLPGIAERGHRAEPLMGSN